MTQRLLLIFGGRSSEHEVLIRSATEVLAAIERDRWEPVLLGVARDGTMRTGSADRDLAEIVRSGDEVVDLRALKPDVVFPLLHGHFGEDGTFQGLLEILDVPYVGCGVFASAVCMHKGAFKQLLASNGIPVVPGFDVHARVLQDPERRASLVQSIAQQLGFPIFVKPSNQGSSVGIGKATDIASLEAALDEAARYDDQLVVEQGVDAREIELAVLGNGGPETRVSQPGEIALPQGTWYDYDNKYQNDTASLHIPADVPPGAITQLQEMALQAFRLANCTGLARIDFFVERGTGRPFLNEVNTMPGFTSISMYPKLMEHSGVAYGALITRLCELGLERHAHRARLTNQR